MERRLIPVRRAGAVNAEQLLTARVGGKEQTQLQAEGVPDDEDARAGGVPGREVVERAVHGAGLFAEPLSLGQGPARPAVAGPVERQDGEAALAARGLPLAARVGTGQPAGPAPVVMHRAPSGLYVELVDRSLREMLSGQDLAMD